MQNISTSFTVRRVPKEIVKIEQLQYTSGIEFTDNGLPQLVYSPGEVLYVGELSPAIDKAWDELIKGRYFSISENKAKELWGEKYKDYRDRIDGGFTGGFDVFHILHYLNHIRMALHPDYYNLDSLHGLVHQLHCIDHIRQSLQYSASITISPTRFRPSIRHNYVESKQLQTCQNFGSIRQFAWERYNGTLAVPRKDGGD
ncbi:hypothetical protein COCC4DRAFT_67259 [Bipolaris maydis ATCC 48331]|uniref:Uncharacterized protein n=1 Tax=Cochliobolus heterostrophus (strain C4 / ATCC 48331 / race T) TaxID=665024 RepID=N4WQZ3_COCH4|nr:uncharacterized protein COCC4DRAFT_67259 [Bipolaris maydis ATCC 48331]ENH98542.1 hypothetical protein COCC4DRAFT_67259 [Bipolaris maydis ATCC 48331]KAJ6274140.1 hypothetical protein PSV08DRAFT_174252 [Bipolaris maydis]